MRTIEEELKYVSNLDLYINLYNNYRQKNIPTPLIDYLEIKAGEVGFDSYKDMLEEGYRVDYSGEYDKYKASYEIGTKKLKELASEKGYKYTSIVEDNYEYKNGLLLIAYANEASLKGIEPIEEIDTICINLDEIDTSEYRIYITPDNYPNLYSVIEDKEELDALYEACNGDEDILKIWDDEAEAYMNGKIISSNFYKALCENNYSGNNSILEYATEYKAFFNADKGEDDYDLE